MTTSLYKKLNLVFGTAGVLFSGYLSGVKYFTSVCAFNEPCPYFLGYPACWYGLAMFLVIFVTALLGILDVISVKTESKVLAFVSGVGILFAGYFTIPEIRNLLSGIQSNYSLGLPTCAYGLIFYVIIFILSI